MEAGFVVLMDFLWSNLIENDSVEGLRPNAPSPSLVTFGPNRVMEFCNNNDLQLIVREHEISEDRLSPKLPNRCKDLVTRIVRLPPQDEDMLVLLLAFWVKAMNPKRVDWLLVLKELTTMESLLLAEVLKHELLEDSFEANVRDYTKLIDIYGKQKLSQKGALGLF
ncbi:hypothetical protein GUJ93_ZPchr0012g20582 [Zizania palustris]|uniref:Uncharacterized protein n=1 Tax=Zizania palustris TaxID=103762 RepID=A0A8J5WTQ2_ZIZPA|nr:hypothetical protein GUJ93_ZPchr0012g20582 [Zizania palustris]